MKKQNKKSLGLSTETVRAMQGAELKGIAGAATSLCTTPTQVGPSCLPSAGHHCTE